MSALPDPPRSGGGVAVPSSGGGVPSARRDRGRRLPGTTVEFTLDGEQGVLSTGRGPDGDVRWVHLRAGVHGSTLAGLADAVSTAITVGLQHGAPAGAYADALRRLRLDLPATDQEALLPASLADCLMADPGTAPQGLGRTHAG